MPSTTDSAVDAAALTAPAEKVEAYIGQFLDSRPMPDRLREAARYAALGPGKRMRPILVIRSAHAVAGQTDAVTAAALPAAAAIELIHAFSLVHDDLPAMDDDDLRRGRPTLHRHTSEAMAILAGDAMMGLAFDLILNQTHDRDRACRIATELSAGTNAMIDGQVYDTLHSFDEDLEPLEQLKTIHRHKTGALIRAAVRMGGISAGADDQALDRLTRYGEAIGLMFQIVDDLLDVTQTTEHLGKTAGKDVDQHKLTYPALLGVDASKAEVERLADEAAAALEPFGEAAEHLRHLCRYLAVRTR